MTMRTQLGLLAALMALVVGLVSAVSIVGREARLVDVVTLFASGVAAGAGVATAVRRRPR